MLLDYLPLLSASGGGHSVLREARLAPITLRRAGALHYRLDVYGYATLHGMAVLTLPHAMNGAGTVTATRDLATCVAYTGVPVATRSQGTADHHASVVGALAGAATVAIRARLRDMRDVDDLLALGEL